MTAGRSINSCKSALYVLLFFSPLCVLRAHRKAVRPASSLSIHGDRIYPLQANPLVVSPPLSLHVFIELRRRRFANNYWSRYGSLLVWGSNHYSFAHETTIGLPMDDYWFIGQRTIVPLCLPWLPLFPRAECFSVLYLIARVIGLRDRPLPAAGEGAPHRRRV